jgi:drug/metabolite transporter (DMT)-like permease
MGPVEIILALAAAVTYGVSDFAGGVLTRRAHVFVVFLLSQLVSLALLLVAVTLWAGAVSWPGVGWGAAAGVAGVMGTSLLYQGLAIGRMSVVAPITGVLGAGLPVLFGLAVGERPGPAALAGIVLGLVAVVVITRAPDVPGAPVAEPRTARQAVLCAFGGGIGLGVVNSAADLLFLLATRRGLLSLVAVITSMYPAVTVALAGLVLRERIAARQAAGLAAAAVSVGLIALG